MKKNDEPIKNLYDFFVKINRLADANDKALIVCRQSCHWRINLRAIYLAMHFDDVATVLHYMKFTPYPKPAISVKDSDN